MLTKSAIKRFILLCIFCLAAVNIAHSQEDVANSDGKALPAFPGAEGFGVYSQGGRGGKVLHVTTLEDEGPGSLRWAVEQEGPRTVVFEISGTIKLKGGLKIQNPFITIAGQTAPGDGICLRDGGLGIAASDVIVRYIRCRLGDQGRGGDAISIGKGEDIIVDHCSASWSTDEVLSASTRHPTLKRLTVQWCFITEALNPRNHGFGSLIRGTEDARYTFHHNLYAHNKGRNPRPGNYHKHNPPDEDPLGLLLDFRNNVIYNFGGGHAGYNNDKDSVTRLNYVGNVVIPGESSAEEWVAYKTCSPNNRGYFADTMMDGTVPDDPWSVINFGEWTPEQIAAYKMTKPHETGPIKTDTPQVALEQILATGGANLPKRDAMDTRVVDSVRNRSGRIIKSQEEVRGWPELKSLPAPTDTDRDGIPDEWESQYGLDPGNAADGPQDKDGDGYTNLEEYLNSTDPTVFIDYTKPENNISSLFSLAPTQIGEETDSSIMHSNVEYGLASGEKLLLDVCQPMGNGPFPVAIYVHGGGWTGGDKANPDDVPVLDMLTEARFTWFSINYRLAPDHRWPACINDVQAAIRWVKANAARYKGDPSRVVLVGYSAGGHLACFAATVVDDSVRVKAVVGCAPLTDFVQELPKRGNILGRAQRGLLNRPEKLTPESVGMLEALSPINHIRPGLPPFLLLHGDKDQSVPYEQSLAFQAKLQTNGVLCDLITLPGAPHRLTKWSHYLPDYHSRIIAWLHKVLGNQQDADG